MDDKKNEILTEAADVLAQNNWRGDLVEALREMAQPQAAAASPSVKPWEERIAHHPDRTAAEFVDAAKDAEIADLRAQLARQQAAPASLDRYDAGLLSDFGGGDVNWWQDYMRAELDRAHDFYQSQIDAAAPTQAAPALPTREQTIEASGDILLRGAKPGEIDYDIALVSELARRGWLAAAPASGSAEGRPAAAVALRNEGYDVVCDRRDLFDFLRAAWREGQDHQGEMDERERWDKATTHATQAIQGWATLRHVPQERPAAVGAGDLRTPTHASADEVRESLEQQLIEHRIGLTPEYEGGWQATVYGDSEEAPVRGYGSSPSEAVKVAFGTPPTSKEGEGA